MRFHRPTMRLRFQHRDHRVDWDLEAAIDPGMRCHDWHRRCRLEDEHADDTLGPRRADFWRGGDDDVTRPWCVAVPMFAVTNAVFDGPLRRARKHPKSPSRFGMDKTDTWLAKRGLDHTSCRRLLHW